MLLFLRILAAVAFPSFLIALVRLVSRSGWPELPGWALTLLAGFIVIMLLLVFGVQRDWRSKLVGWLASNVFGSVRRLVFVNMVLVGATIVILGWTHLLLITISGEALVDAYPVDSKVVIRVAGRTLQSDENGRFEFQIADKGQSEVGLVGQTDNRWGMHTARRGAFEGIQLVLDKPRLDTGDDAGAGGLGERISRQFDTERREGAKRLIRAHLTLGDGGDADLAILDRRMFVIKFGDRSTVYGFAPHISSDEKKIAWLPLQFGPGDQVQQWGELVAPPAVRIGKPVEFEIGEERMELVATTIEHGDYDFATATPGIPADPSHPSSVYRGDRGSEICCVTCKPYTLCANSVDLGCGSCSMQQAVDRES